MTDEFLLSYSTRMNPSLLDNVSKQFKYIKTFNSYQYNNKLPKIFGKKITVFVDHAENINNEYDEFSMKKSADLLIYLC